MKCPDVHIVGGGIVGLCTALYLTKAGCKVCIIESGNFADGTSYGNAGMIVPSHFVPMASPGVIKQGLKWLTNPKSPFYIKPRLNVDLLQWIWQFYRHANHTNVQQAASILLELNQKSKSLYKSLSQVDNMNFHFEEKGLLMLYRSSKALEKEASMIAMAHELGVSIQTLEGPALAAIEPHLDILATGGIYFPQDAHLHPNRLMGQLIKYLKQSEVQILSNKTVCDFKYKDSKVNTLISKDHDEIPVQKVVLTTGCWTAKLLKKMGVQMYLQDGKGYSFTYNKVDIKPHVPTILAEAKVAITPMGNDLRIGGTLELSGINRHINQKRIEGILESIPRYYGNFCTASYVANEPVWQGFRPCSPDGMPYLCTVKKLKNVYVGTGHGMMGLSLGAISGKILSDLVCNVRPDIDIRPFRMDRF